MDQNTTSIENGMEWNATMCNTHIIVDMTPEMIVGQLDEITY